MKRRYYFIIFVLLFGAAMWGLAHSVVTNAPGFDTPFSNDSTRYQPGPAPLPEVPAPLTQDNSIVINTPTEGQTITSPLTISGKAQGTWFFEATFPVALTKEDGTIIASGIARAQGDWMTTDYVPFVATLTFTVPFSPAPTTGYVVLKKDNPSGSPQFDKSVSIKVQW